MKSLRWESSKFTDCQKCSGIGVIYDPKVHIGRYGQLKVCECVESECRCGDERPYQCWDGEGNHRWCDCRPFRRRVSETAKLFKAADIPERYKWKFIEAFQRVSPDGIAIPFADEVLRMVFTVIDGEVKSEPTRGFLMHGNPGTGKTLLASIMLNELILRWGRPGRFLNLSRKYFQQLRDTYSEESVNYGRSLDIVDELCNMPFLVLDDFGIQRGTEWEMEMLYELVDARYAEERFTVVTTNQNLEELKKISDGRVFSRLLEMCYSISMEGVDFREHVQGIS